MTEPRLERTRLVTRGRCARSPSLRNRREGASDVVTGESLGSDSAVEDRGRHRVCDALITDTAFPA